MDILTNVVTLGAAVSLGLTLLAKFLPNEKVYSVGFSIGSWMNGFGTSKIGRSAWEKIENFLINSAGQFFGGMRDGLNEGEDPVDKKDERPDVRT